MNETKTTAGTGPDVGTTSLRAATARAPGARLTATPRLVLVAGASFAATLPSSIQPPLGAPWKPRPAQLYFDAKPTEARTPIAAP